MAARPSKNNASVTVVPPVHAFPPGNVVAIAPDAQTLFLSPGLNYHARFSPSGVGHALYAQLATRALTCFARDGTLYTCVQTLRPGTTKEVCIVLCRWPPDQAYSSDTDAMHDTAVACVASPTDADDVLYAIVDRKAREAGRQCTLGSAKHKGALWPVWQPQSNEHITALAVDGNTLYACVMRVVQEVADNPDSDGLVSMHLVAVRIDDGHATVNEYRLAVDSGDGDTAVGALPPVYSDLRACDGIAIATNHVHAAVLRHGEVQHCRCDAPMLCMQPIPGNRMLTITATADVAIGPLPGDPVTDAQVVFLAALQAQYHHLPLNTFVHYDEALARIGVRYPAPQYLPDSESRPLVQYCARDGCVHLAVHGGTVYRIPCTPEAVRELGDAWRPQTTEIATDAIMGHLNSAAAAQLSPTGMLTDLLPGDIAQLRARAPRLLDTTAAANTLTVAYLAVPAFVADRVQELGFADGIKAALRVVAALAFGERNDDGVPLCVPDTAPQLSLGDANAAAVMRHAPHSALCTELQGYYSVPTHGDLLCHPRTPAAVPLLIAAMTYALLEIHMKQPQPSVGEALQTVVASIAEAALLRATAANGGTASLSQLHAYDSAAAQSAVRTMFHVPQPLAFVPFASPGGAPLCTCYLPDGTVESLLPRTVKLSGITVHHLTTVLLEDVLHARHQKVAQLYALTEVGDGWRYGPGARVLPIHRAIMETHARLLQEEPDSNGLRMLLDKDDVTRMIAEVHKSLVARGVGPLWHPGMIQYIATHVESYIRVVPPHYDKTLQSMARNGDWAQAMQQWLQHSADQWILRAKHERAAAKTARRANVTRVVA